MFEAEAVGPMADSKHQAVEGHAQSRLDATSFSMPGIFKTG